MDYSSFSASDRNWTLASHYTKHNRAQQSSNWTLSCGCIIIVWHKKRHPLGSQNTIGRHVTQNVAFRVYPSAVIFDALFKSCHPEELEKKENFGCWWEGSTFDFILMQSMLGLDFEILKSFVNCIGQSVHHSSIENYAVSRQTPLYSYS